MKLYHRGAPCDPPIVNGITFAPDKESDQFFSAEVTQEQADLFIGVDSFVDDPTKSLAPVLAVVSTDADKDKLIAHLNDQVSALQSRVQDFQSRVSQLTDENAALVAAGAAADAEIAELQEALSASEDESVSTEGLDALKAEIEALETKKAAEGKLSFADNMKLGKLNKKLAALVS